METEALSSVASCFQPGTKQPGSSVGTEFELLRQTVLFSSQVGEGVCLILYENHSGPCALWGCDGSLETALQWRVFVRKSGDPGRQESTQVHRHSSLCFVLLMNLGTCSPWSLQGLNFHLLP